MDFVTIDFETATAQRDSPCEIGLTFVENFRIVDSKSWLIKPLYEEFNSFNISIHGIEPWKDGQFYDVLTYEDFNLKGNDREWYWEAFHKFIGLKIELQCAASYEVPKELLDKDKSE